MTAYVSNCRSRRPQGYFDRQKQLEGAGRLMVGWMFDGYETWALVLVMTPAVRQLLSPERLPKASIYVGGPLTATLLGWAAGGIAAGLLADYVGRRRMLMLSILCYAVFAGLTALCWDYWSPSRFPLLYGDRARRRVGTGRCDRGRVLATRVAEGGLPVHSTLLMEWV